MPKPTITCQCCGASFTLWVDFMEHVQDIMNVGVGQLPIAEGHPHSICECDSCESLRRIYPPDEDTAGLILDMGGEHD